MKKIIWIIKRHPFLYFTRFRLLSRNATIEDIESERYDKINNKKELPKIYFKINSEIFKEGKPIGTLEQAKKIAMWITARLQDKPGLSYPSDTALEIMLSGEGGVCSDMAQVFNNFCLLNDIQVREWGVTRAPFDRTYGGHSFNEIFVKEINKWVLFDSFWCLYFQNNSGDLLSVVELYDGVRNEMSIEVKQFYQLPYLKPKGYEQNFLYSNNVPFLICNYSNKTYDFYLKKLKPYLPIFVIHFLVFLMRKSYYYKFPIDNYKKILN